MSQAMVVGETDLNRTCLDPDAVACELRTSRGNTKQAPFPCIFVQKISK